MAEQYLLWRRPWALWYATVLSALSPCFLNEVPHPRHINYEREVVANHA